MDVPGDCDERTGTQTSLRAKAHVPAARCPWQTAGTMIDDGERQPPPEPKTLVVVATTTSNATAVTTMTTQAKHVPLSNRPR